MYEVPPGRVALRPVGRRRFRPTSPRCLKGPPGEGFPSGGIVPDKPSTADAVCFLLCVWRPLSREGGPEVGGD